VVLDSYQLLFDNLHPCIEQDIQVDKLVVEGMKLSSMHIVHQQQLEDMSLDLRDMFDMSLGTVYDKYHQDIWHNLLGMFHELGKEQLNLQYIHHLGIEVSL
jgi:hypothetical protein